MIEKRSSVIGMNGDYKFGIKRNKCWTLITESGTVIVLIKNCNTPVVLQIFYIVRKNQ